VDQDKGRQVFDARPIYVQLIERIKTRVVSGEYAPGAQIPSVRELAEAFGVNPNTMQKALTELEREDLVSAQRTVGRFVTEDVELIQRLKTELAQTHISQFLREMAALGIEAAVAVELLVESVKNREETFGG